MAVMKDNGYNKYFKYRKEDGNNLGPTLNRKGGKYAIPWINPRGRKCLKYHKNEDVDKPHRHPQPCNTSVQKLINLWKGLKIYYEEYKFCHHDAVII